MHMFIHANIIFNGKGVMLQCFHLPICMQKKCTIWQSYDLSNYTKGKLWGQMKNKLDLVSSYYLVSSLVP